MQGENQILKSVLIIEDELDLREILADIYIEANWTVKLALEFSEIERNIDFVDAVLMDWGIPGIDSELLHKTVSKRPVLVVSGDPNCPIKDAWIKPFLPQEAVSRTQVMLDLFLEDFNVGDIVVHREHKDLGLGMVDSRVGDEFAIWFSDKPLPMTCPKRVLRKPYASEHGGMA